MSKTLTVREAALQLGCTLKHVYDLVHASKIEAQKDGHAWRISAAAIRNRLKARDLRRQK